ncbi:MAG: MATE family efflux transporter [Christensenellaceae bacterium]|nr:MATE family efflux transporter [Christensenellaceae bacterium]
MKAANLISDLRPHISRVWKLSVPAILTQITTVAMQYIDSAMVGRLGANASASIGLVSTSTWVMSGVSNAVVIGFSVQVAQCIGAEEAPEARRVSKHGFITALIISLLLMLLGVAISSPLPRWLGGEEALWKDSSAYFFMFAITMPFMVINRMAASFLQSAGNMVVPSILNALMCVLDVILNAIFIPKYGVLGAGLGTCLAVVIVCFVEFWFCCFRYEPLRLNRKESCPFDGGVLRRALKIGAPVGVESMALSGAQVVSTTIIAPLGAVSIAAHSLSITAESLCFMPGYGISTAAMTLVGQSVGAKDYTLARRYGYITVAFGCAVMAFTGVLMYIFCPYVFRMLTPVKEVQDVAVRILRIGLIAEPLYGVAMVSSGALRGAADTLVPSILNLFSMWVVRLGLAFTLVPLYGIYGMWTAMAIELCVRGILMFTRLLRSKHMRYDLV